MPQTDIKEPVIVDNNSGHILPSPKGIKLKSIDDVRVEMASVYRGMKSGSIETSDGTKLVYVLSAIAKAIEIHDIEQRIKLLEEKKNG